MIRATLILADSNFRRLSISLLFGLVTSTFLSVRVIATIRVALQDDGRAVLE